jgi:hypothetical protein
MERRRSVVHCSGFERGGHRAVIEMPDVLYKPGHWRERLLLAEPASLLPVRSKWGTVGVGERVMLLYVNKSRIC